MSEADAERLARQIRDALDMDEDETLVLQGPQFERRDGVDPSDPPLTPSAFESLWGQPSEALTDLGMRCWSDDIYLLPHEWYPHIPDGVELVDLDGETFEFDRSEASDDKRFGVLAYGVRAGESAASQSTETDRLEESIDEVVSRLRDRGEMVLSDELIEECHPYGHALLDAADEVEQAVEDCTVDTDTDRSNTGGDDTQ